MIEGPIRPASPHSLRRRIDDALKPRTRAKSNETRVAHDHIDLIILAANIEKLGILADRHQRVDTRKTPATCNPITVFKALKTHLYLSPIPTKE